jgi:hypothetical protein
LILAAENPATPTAPSTSINGDYVDITWSAPNSMGSPIIAYSISIITSDGVSYAIDYVDCDGS